MIDVRSGKSEAMGVACFSSTPLDEQKLPVFVFRKVVAMLR